MPPFYGTRAFALRSPVNDEAWRTLKQLSRVSDLPEVLVLGGLLAGVFSLGLYTLKREWIDDATGAYVNPVVRGDPERQVETGRVAGEAVAQGQHSLLWRVAQIKMDAKGPNCGVFDNRSRPNQYTKPGFTGLGAAGLAA